MRIPFKIALVALAFWLGAGAAAFAASVGAKPTVGQSLGVTVAIVDVQRILQASEAAQSVKAQLEAQRSRFQGEITKEEAELREAEKKLAQLRQEAKTQAYVEEEQKLQQRFLTVERHVQARRKALDQAFADSMNTVREALVEVVSEVAKANGFNLVLVKQQVIWNGAAVDITDEVLSRLNKELPKVSVRVVADEAVEKTSPVLRKGSISTFLGQ